MKTLATMAAMFLLIFASVSFADTGDVLKAAHEKVVNGETSAAIGILQEGIQKAPGDADLRFMIAGLFFQQRKFEDAVLQYEKVAQLQKDNKHAYNNLGNTHFKLGQLNQAELAYKFALQLDENFADAWNGLGNVLGARKDMEGSESSYRKALALDPDNRHILLNLGAVLFSSGRTKEAIGYWEKADKASPGAPDILYNLAIGYLNTGKKSKAEAIRMRLVDIDPKLAEILKKRLAEEEASEKPVIKNP